MRKSDNRKPGPKGKSGSFKPKGKTDRKPGSRPYSDGPKKRNDDFAGRKERPDDTERRPRRSFDTGSEKPDGFRARRKESDAGDKSFRPSARPRKAGSDRADDKPRRVSSRSFEEKPRRSSAGSSDDKPRRRASDGDDRPRRREGAGDEKPKRSFDDRGERKSFRGAGSDRESRTGDRKSRPSFGDKPDRARRSSGSRDERPARRSDAGAGDKPFSAFRKEKSPDRAEKPRRGAGNFEERKPSRKGKNDEEGTKRVKYDDFEEGRAFAKRPERSGKPFKQGPIKKGPKKAAPARIQSEDGKIRLNKYLSNAGVASRREADTLIQSGVVKVNGVVVDQLGYKINPGDKVTYGDAPVRSERKVYLLLNKPKDYITTTDDPQERKTVMELIAKACKERVYPVGRLDRNTTGLLLFTNDGELTTKLMHPKFKIKKVYHVSLNKGLKPEDFKAIMEGIELEDGLIKADDLAFVGEGKKEIGIEIHSGRNRIVRRIFEHLGYDVLKLDRVSFAGLTKKDLPRGKHRFLTGKEIAFLQMIG
jgi:23S rRNA pseudouridine2605 synthase